MLPRDNLASVSKDAIASPGPGTYVALEDQPRASNSIQFQT